MGIGSWGMTPTIYHPVVNPITKIRTTTQNSSSKKENFTKEYKKNIKALQNNKLSELPKLEDLYSKETISKYETVCECGGNIRVNYNSNVKWCDTCHRFWKL